MRFAVVKERGVNGNEICQIGRNRNLAKRGAQE